VTGAVLQSQDDAPGGLLDDWAAARGFALEVLRVDRLERLPDPRGYAFVVVLGSTASVAHPEHAWLPRALEFVRAADAACVPVLGICFGAQLLAAALGGRVRRLPKPEVGWVRVDSCDPERVPAGPWMAWHEDGLDLPPLAYEIARNAFGVQAFCHCRHLAVQFHPEVTAEIADQWTREGRRDLELAGATAEAVFAATEQHAAAAAAAAARLFDGFAARAGLPALASRA
jgi:GMP synthase-like glutamine amidotransferase